MAGMISSWLVSESHLGGQKGRGQEVERFAGSMGKDAPGLQGTSMMILFFLEARKRQAKKEKYRGRQARHDQPATLQGLGCL